MTHIAKIIAAPDYIGKLHFAQALEPANRPFAGQAYAVNKCL